MINYKNEKIDISGCPGCAYAEHKFSLPCGMAYENDRFTISQDWELPIPGFLVVSPKKCVENFSELNKEEQIELFALVDKTIKVLRENNICDKFNVIFEEKEKIHFHVWIMPRYEWMKDVAGKITKNIGVIFKYADDNMKTIENFEKIDQITNLVKLSFEKMS